eukprot:TRINITY_DN2401_c0_g8_i1.p1 TRINITY_DN2401_c0_g8~~TRINITY_DN2401_c0_g8_i1.p1  ORF type:complete len:319 (-),score=61.22 TRINITY_DN2401_c0_g8_i1:561-1517(-)
MCIRDRNNSDAQLRYSKIMEKQDSAKPSFSLNRRISSKKCADPLGTFLLTADAIDLECIIPPMNLLPNFTNSFEDTLTLSLVPITKKNPLHRHNVSTVERSDVKEESVEYVKERVKRKKEVKVEKKVSVKMLVKSVLATTGVEGLYALEFSNLRQNPVVYSRNGKANCNSDKRSSLNFSFTKGDLQRIQSAHSKGYKWSFMDPLAKIEPYYHPANDQDQTLVFESRFESGNLGLAIQGSENEYFLVVQNDTMSSGHTQCKNVCDVGFYFKVRNAAEGQTVRFHIVNFVLFGANIVQKRFSISAGDESARLFFYQEWVV